MMNYMSLQNGSDIRGVALPGIEGQNVALTEDACRAIGYGFFRWIAQRINKKNFRIAVGRDSRLSGPQMVQWITETLVSCGAEVTDLGLSTTPSMFMCTVTPGYLFDASVMVTASHLPFNRNGYKFFTAKGGLEHEDITEILEYAGSFTPDVLSGCPSGRVLKDSFMDTYANLLKDKIASASGCEKPLQGLRISVDAGNGAGGFFAENILKPLGADTTGSQFLEPDGSFPNHIPNPENKEAMESVTAAVLENHADLGIIFDTDVDRAGAVLPDGSELNRNKLIAIFSAILLREFPGTTIVTDSVTSTGLAAFIKEKGGVHHRFRRGYRNVINESVRLNKEGIDSQLAMETSGHGALKENYFLDDGAYLMTRLLIELARGKKEGYSLSDLVSGLKEPVEASEFRFNISVPDFKAYGEQVLSDLSGYAAGQPGWIIAPDNHEGIRVTIGEGWFLLRMSLHDPLLPLNIESDREGQMKQIALGLLPFLKRYDALDIEKFRKYCEE